MGDELEEAQELLRSWVALAREGAFNGDEFTDCEDDCDCIACKTEGYLA